MNRVSLINCSATGKGIQSIKKSAISPIDIVLENVQYGGYVVAFAENIYHKNNQTDFVAYYNFSKRREQWTFKNICFLKEPCGISVDNDGNVSVEGNVSENVVVVSADGKQHKKILKVSENLVYPYTLDHNRSTNELSVANGTGKAMLFTVDD